MKKHLFRSILILVLVLVMLGTVGVLAADAHVRQTGSRILTVDEAAALENVDCILVLGCLVYDSGSPSPMLADRLDRGIELYEQGAAPKLLMSGDHGRIDYNEVGAMKQYALDAGIDSEDVFMDHAGFSTYDSIYRSKEVFAADKILIVTQEYHLCRALYIAESLGVEAYGVAAEDHTYAGQSYREVREVLARAKDFALSILQPEPTFLGEVIPVSGSGDLTND